MSSTAKGTLVLGICALAFFGPRFLQEQKEAAPVEITEKAPTVSTYIEEPLAEPMEDATSAPKESTPSRDKLSTTATENPYQELRESYQYLDPALVAERQQAYIDKTISLPLAESKSPVATNTHNPYQELRGRLENGEIPLSNADSIDYLNKTRVPQ